MFRSHLVYFGLLGLSVHDMSAVNIRNKMPGTLRKAQEILKIL